MKIIQTYEDWFNPLFWKDYLREDFLQSLTQLTYKQIKNIQVILDSYLPKDRNWHLIALVLDISNIKIYINAKLVYILNYESNQYIKTNWAIGAWLLSDFNINNEPFFIIDKMAINYIDS